MAQTSSSESEEDDSLAGSKAAMTLAVVVGQAPKTVRPPNQSPPNPGPHEKLTLSLRSQVAPSLPCLPNSMPGRRPQNRERKPLCPGQASGPLKVFFKQGVGT